MYMYLTDSRGVARILEKEGGIVKINNACKNFRPKTSPTN